MYSQAWLEMGDSGLSKRAKVSMITITTKLNYIKRNTLHLQPYMGPVIAIIIISFLCKTVS